MYVHTYVYTYICICYLSLSIYIYIYIHMCVCVYIYIYSFYIHPSCSSVSCACLRGRARDPACVHACMSVRGIHLFSADSDHRVFICLRMCAILCPYCLFADVSCGVMFALRDDTHRCAVRGDAA